MPAPWERGDRRMPLRPPVNHHKPWQEFLHKRRDFALRFFLDPPSQLAHRIYEGYAPEDIERLKRGIRNTLGCNSEKLYLKDSACADIEKMVFAALVG